MINNKEAVATRLRNAHKFFIPSYWLTDEYWIDKPSELTALIYIIGKAYWQDDVYPRGNEVLHIKRGQYPVSFDHLRKRCGWKSKTDVVRFINKYEKLGYFVTETVQGVRVITICNYNEISGLPDTRCNANGTQTEQERNDLCTNNSNYSNNSNNSNKYNDHFDSVWNLYPRKIAKKAAYKSYVAALRRGEDAEQIKLGVMNYARQIELDGTAPNYVLHGSTFFSQDRYKDYVDAACTTNTDFSLDSKPHTTTPVAPSAGSAGLPKIPLSEIRAMQEHFDDKRAVVRYYRGGHDEAFRKFAKVGIDRVVDDVDGQ